MPHGLLFIGYVILAIVLKYELDWKSKTFFTVLAASIIPFGTFYIDKKYKKYLGIKRKMHNLYRKNSTSLQSNGRMGN